jgi:ribosome-binding protein aMBF1 (putative translation factor)
MKQAKTREALMNDVAAAHVRTMPNASRLSPEAIALSALLRQARYEAGLSVETVAERAEVPASTVRKIEAGRMKPTIETFRRALAACEPIEDGNVTNGGTDSP